MNKSFTPVRVGRYTLSNRLVMAPMTRSRAKSDGTPGELAAEYYAQRAGVGLIVTEGTQPSDDGQGYLATPGIYTSAHVAGWKKVTKAVHGKGGHIFIQVMHAGRMSHPDNTPHHRQAVAPSAIAPGVNRGEADQATVVPRDDPRQLSVRNTVVRMERRQDHRLVDPCSPGSPQVRTERRRQPVNHAQAGVRQRDAGEQRRIGHRRARLPDIARALVPGKQSASRGDEALFRERVGHRARAA